MGDLFQADRPKYCPQCDKNSGHHEDCCQAPVLLTQLRTDAIAHVLEMENGFTAEQAQATAAEIFETWAQARHDAILDHMAPQVIETLESIRRSIQSADGTSVLIGAITDGNSNPGRVEALRPYFDFVVNAESVGVAKPDKRVYLEAVRVIALKHPTFSGLLSENATMEELEDLVGPYWVHVGDDFLKDVVAAKNMKMRTIWAVELVKHKLLAASKSDNNSSMEMEEFLKKVSSESVVSLGIGADDYLATSLTSEFVDAVAEGFSDVGRILADWHSVTKQEAAAPSNGEVATSKNDPTLTKANRNMPPVAALVNKQSDAGIDLVAPRAFRIIRENCSTDVPAPLKNRSSQTMKEVMSVAQLDKSSGVFGFSPEDAAALQAGEKALVIGIGGTELQFAKEIFSAMTVEEVLSLTEENPVSLNFILKEAVAQGPSIDLF
jgi:FMN phosphatase YigB (HAD superfamily)